MPVRDCEATVEEAVKSVCMQTYPHFRIRVIDDGSSDRTPEIVGRLARRDSRIILTQKKSSEGLGRRLHDGVLDCRSEFVARMDGDDRAHPERLERQVALMTRYPDVGICGTWARDINGKGEFVGERKMPIEHRDIASLIWTNPLIHPSVMFRRKIVLDVGNYRDDLIKRQDYELWFRALRAGVRFSNIGEFLLDYRVNEDHYVKNDRKVAWKTFLIGLKGSLSVRASKEAYIGLMFPLVVSLLGPGLRLKVRQRLGRFDPRRRFRK